MCRPWLLEVNHSPSFTTDMAVDRRVKEALLRDTLQLVSSLPALSQDYDHKIQGHCRRVHGHLAIMQQGHHRPSRLPVGGPGRVQKVFDHAGNLSCTCLAWCAAAQHEGVAFNVQERDRGWPVTFLVVESWHSSSALLHTRPRTVAKKPPTAENQRLQAHCVGEDMLAGQLHCWCWAIGSRSDTHPDPLVPRDCCIIHASTELHRPAQLQASSSHLNPQHRTGRCSRTLPRCHGGGQGRYSHAPAQLAAPRGSAAVQPRPPGRAAPLGGASAQHVQRPCLTLVLRLVASPARHAARLLLQPQLRQVSHLQMCLQVHAAQGGGHHA